jgi:hypothetical protein
MPSLAYPPRPPIRKPYTPEKPKGANAMTIALGFPFREIRRHDTYSPSCRRVPRVFSRESRYPFGR